MIYVLYYLMSCMVFFILISFTSIPEGAFKRTAENNKDKPNWVVTFGWLFGMIVFSLLWAIFIPHAIYKVFVSK